MNIRVGGVGSGTGIRTAPQPSTLLNCFIRRAPRHVRADLRPPSLIPPFECCLRCPVPRACTLARCCYVACCCALVIIELKEMCGVHTTKGVKGSVDPYEITIERVEVDATLETAGDR